MTDSSNLGDALLSRLDVLAQNAGDHVAAFLKLQEERDALALKLEVATRDLEYRTSERDRAIVERDDSRKCNFRLQQKARRGELRDDGVALEALIAQRDDALRDAKRVLAERNAAIAHRDDAIKEHDALALRLEATTRELECRTAERDAAIAAQASALGSAASLERRMQTVSETADLERRVADLESAVAYASDRKDAMDERLAALEAASARADADRMLETELPHAFVDKFRKPCE